MLADLAAVVQDLRREAKAKGVNKLSMREINATVAAARRGMKKSGKQPVK